jgi:hypothetical protein
MFLLHPGQPAALGTQGMGAHAVREYAQQSGLLGDEVAP